MRKKSILFISSNRIWSGSEILWSASASGISKEFLEVKTAVYFDYEQMRKFVGHDGYIDLRQKQVKFNLPKRVARKLLAPFREQESILQRHLSMHHTDLVIISQGNNTDGRAFMETCIACAVPFVTLTHLVTEELWPSLDDLSVNELRKLYKQALKNYFVSKSTLATHEKLLAQHFSNCEIVYNPFIAGSVGDLRFPEYPGGTFKVALVGRVEMYHKGYDLLIDVLKLEKWRTRNIHFSLFGTGPHIEILKRLIKHHHILNFTLNGHTNDISEIWSTHHLLLMPSRMEGQSLSLIEAMRLKRAAVVTAVGGTAELVHDEVNGFVAAYPTVANLDEALERAWSKRDKWQEMGLKAAETISMLHPSDAVDYFNQKILGLMGS